MRTEFIMILVAAIWGATFYLLYQRQVRSLTVVRWRPYIMVFGGVVLAVHGTTELQAWKAATWLFVAAYFGMIAFQAIHRGDQVCSMSFGVLDLLVLMTLVALGFGIRHYVLSFG